MYHIAENMVARASNNDLDLFSGFRALNQAACSNKGPACSVYIMLCVLTALFLLIFFGFFVAVGIYSCCSYRRHIKREELMEMERRD